MTLLSQILESGVENAVTHQVAEYLRRNGFKLNVEKCTPEVSKYFRNPKDPYEDKHDEVVSHLSDEKTFPKKHWWSK